MPDQDWKCPKCGHVLGQIHLTAGVNTVAWPGFYVLPPDEAIPPTPRTSSAAADANPHRPGPAAQPEDSGSPTRQ